jgi:hypothetical protein
MAPLSRVKFEALSNLTYWIAVDGRDGFAGNVKLSIQQKRTTVAPNDYIANATRVLMGTAAPVSNVGGTKEQDEPNHAGNLGGASMWFRLDISGGNPVRITTQGSTFDTLLAVYTNSFGRFQMPNVATTMRDLRFVAANDDAEGTNRTSEITILPPVSGTYWVAVDGYNGAEGNIRLNVTQSVPTSGPAPRNDRFLNAERLEGSSALTGVNTLFAATEAGEPVHRGQRSSGRSVWYRWTAPESGPVYLSTEWSSFDTWLSVFVGTNVATLQPIAFNDDANGLRTSTLLFDAVGGVEYRISVAGYQGAGGEMVLMLNQPKASVPRMITHWDGARFALSVASVSDRMLLEASSDLVDWRPIRWIGPGEEIGDLEPSANPGCEFYRVVAIE